MRKNRTRDALCFFAALALMPMPSMSDDVIAVTIAEGFTSDFLPMMAAKDKVFVEKLGLDTNVPIDKVTIVEAPFSQMGDRLKGGPLDAALLQRLKLLQHPIDADKLVFK